MNKNFTYIGVVLDRSGSMTNVKKQTIDGYNEFLNKQKLEPGQAHIYLAQFDDQYDVVYDQAVQTAERLTDSTFIPRGMTALYDAIGRTVTDLGKKFSGMAEAERPEKVVVAILTDGGENSSHEYDSTRVKALLDEQRSKYNWDFVFIGANQDAILSASIIGIQSAKAMNYTVNNTQSVMGQSLSNYVGAVRGMSAGTLDMAKFSEEERAAAVA